jgi:hypothetical protein
MLQKEQCNKCYWWDKEHERIKGVPDWITGMSDPGFCRKHKPAPERVAAGYYLGVQVIMDALDGCGEFRDRIKE